MFLNNCFRKFREYIYGVKVSNFPFNIQITARTSQFYVFKIKKLKFLEYTQSSLNNSGKFKM